ncbi:hypothetical protein PYK79_45110 [Streptomyces sp. ID05-04B]|uniref:hypothetical protein n=1 Tax=unclassified Streptomyces TaxID=2593676 RepID=UPI000D1BC216|nr:MULTISPECIES: hypothetical protein [unclassified Streptomyces]AVV46429.1 hypothetical protein C6376_38830 [Streptomyces sp. P3]AVV46488.1 hypothetical protein C6376_39130 [Streptomyces sp. P3]MDX5569028.1 hypothetical protein [Streptomyces sp. ID05-04B]
MTAIEERAAGVSGQSIHDSGRLSVDGATRATLPHLPYADAVDRALAAMEFLPDTIETGMRKEPGPSGQRELFLRLEWLPGHDDLVPDAICASGLVVQWSHLAGWSARADDDLVALAIADLANPALVADAAMHAALHGLRCACEKPDADGRWEQAVYLDIALVAYDERVDGVAE